MSLDTLKTARLVIRPLEVTDAPAVYALGREPHISAAMPSLRYDDPDELAAELRFYADDNHEIACNEKPLYWAVMSVRDRTLVGHIGLSPYYDDVEVAYAISATHCGNGFASEAVLALTSYWLALPGRHKVYGVTLETNIASYRVLERSGFTLLERGELLYRGEMAFGRKYEKTV